MPVKPAHPKVDEGPVTRGKGLDSLESFIIQNWAPPTRFGVWNGQVAALAPAKVSLEHFLNDALKAGWLNGGAGAVITIDPPRDPFTTIRVESENKNWTPESKYNPKHWLWKVVPVASALGSLAAALRMPPAEAEDGYLRELQAGKLKAAWDHQELPCPPPPI